MSKIWRVNYVITYANNSVANQWRKRLLSLLETVAHLQQVEISVKEQYTSALQIGFEESSPFAGFVSDLVYFRSLPNTAIPPKDFRKLISSLFANHQCIHFDTDFEVAQQLLKSLPDFPFPDVS